MGMRWTALLLLQTTFEDEVDGICFLWGFILIFRVCHLSGFCFCGNFDGISLTLSHLESPSPYLRSRCRLYVICRIAILLYFYIRECPLYTVHHHMGWLGD